MSRRLLALALVLGLAAAACAQAPVAPQLGSGPGFFAQVVDPLNDAGHHPSVAVVDGRPVIAYFAFEEPVSEGSLPETRPVTAPSLPGVMLATEQDGVWARGAIAIAEQIPNVQVAFNPAFERSVGRLTAESVTGLQLAADDTGKLHAVWGSADGVFYATGTADPASATQWTVERVTRTPGIGPSLAVDGTGMPWISYLTSTSQQTSVEVASMDGGAWRVERVARVAGCASCRTAMLATGDGPAVAFADGGTVRVAARSDRGRWNAAEVGEGSAHDLAGTATSDGIALAYYAGEGVQVATGPSGGPFGTATVATVSPGAADAAGAGTSIAVDDAGTLWVAWTDGDAGVTMASGDGTTFSTVDTGSAGLGGTMPSVATTPDGATGYVAWYDPGPQDLVLGTFGDLTGLAIARTSPTPTAPGQATTAPPTEECTPVKDGKVTVVAEGIAFTDGICIQASAGEPFTILFDNRDAGVQHNVQIFTGPEPSGNTLFEGEIITGPSQIEYRVPALDAGEYAYNCVIHPTTMIGKILVGEAGGATGPTGATGPAGPTGGGGGGGEAPTTIVVAQNIAFDTQTIVLPADTEATITFDNRDAGVPHNIAIYRDSSLAEQLFNGETITGPATTTYTIPPLPPGEYYFLCIVHPNMNGTVTVR